MAGGRFTGQNKVRAGVYTNFKAVSRATTELGSRGVVALAMPLPWGKQVTEILSTDLADGRSVAKVGLSITDEEVLALRLALQNAYKAVVYRADTNGSPASAVIGDSLIEDQSVLNITALHAGVFGNRIGVAIKQTVDGKYEVITYLDGRVMDSQVIDTYNQLVANDYVSFSSTTENGIPIVSAGTELRGGENGVIEVPTLVTDFLAEIKKHNWNVLAFPYEGSENLQAVTAIIDDLRNNRGKYRQAVVLNGATANNVGIISVSQGYVAGNDYVSPESFVYFAAGLQAGSELTQSNTYREIAGATEIINEYYDDEILEKIQKGNLVISKRNDGVIVVEKDINTLSTFTLEQPYAYSKNKVIRIMDGVATWVSDRFSAFYIGKVANNADGRAIFKADVIGYLETLQTIGAISEFEPQTDVEVLAGDEIDGVVCNLTIKPTDAMEKLYLTVTVQS